MKTLSGLKWHLLSSSRGVHQEGMSVWQGVEERNKKCAHGRRGSGAIARLTPLRAAAWVAVLSLWWTVLLSHATLSARANPLTAKDICAMQSFKISDADGDTILKTTRKSHVRHMKDSGIVMKKYKPGKSQLSEIPPAVANPVPAETEWNRVVIVTKLLKERYSDDYSKWEQGWGKKMAGFNDCLWKAPDTTASEGASVPVISEELKAAVFAREQFGVVVPHRLVGPVLLMQHVPGETLLSTVLSLSDDEERVELVLRQVWQKVAEILVLLNKAGVIHGDVFAKNILWDDDTEEVYLLDFEFSSLTPEACERLRHDNVLELGWLCYWSSIWPIKEDQAHFSWELFSEEFRNQFYYRPQVEARDSFAFAAYLGISFMAQRVEGDLLFHQAVPLSLAYFETQEKDLRILDSTVNYFMKNCSAWPTVPRLREKLSRKPPLCHEAMRFTCGVWRNFIGTTMALPQPGQKEDPRAATEAVTRVVNGVEDTAVEKLFWKQHRYLMPTLYYAVDGYGQYLLGEDFVKVTQTAHGSAVFHLSVSAETLVLLSGLYDLWHAGLRTPIHGGAAAANKRKGRRGQLR